MPIKVNNITNMETEKTSTRINKKSNLSDLYSFSREIENNLITLSKLEKEIIWINNSIIKVNDQVLISKLEKKKEELENQRKNLYILNEKIAYVVGSIKDFILFFAFIGRFQKLAIRKLNFENDSKPLSSKLIFMLKGEEERLYNAYIEGDCFSKVLKNLSFESYQCYFQEFTKNFFNKILTSSDPYVNALLILRAIFFECSYFCKDQADDFDLTDIKFFLSKHIPNSVILPISDYELIALRCFFYYEIVKEYLKLKLVKNNLKNLKNSIILDSNIENYKSSNKEALIIGLYDIQKFLRKIEKKHSDFLEIKSEERESDVKDALIFYKKILNEIEALDKKNKVLISNNYTRLTKMRHMLAIIINEEYLPKLLEVFNSKIGNDFFLNGIENFERVETNKEALNYLFHAICRDEFCMPLKANAFAKEMTEGYCEDISVLENINLEDLIEFSFYYIFTLFYPDINAELNGFKNKLLYAEMITFHIFFNFKLKNLELLEKKGEKNICFFLGENFKTKEKYLKCKEEILTEIEVNLGTIQGIKLILSDAMALEKTLIPMLVSSLIPRPEENSLADSYRKFEKKQKACELKYQKIKKHEFINKSKKLTKINDVHPRDHKQIGFIKSIENLSELLVFLSENLDEILIKIKGNHQNNQSCQKVSTMSRFSILINKLISNLSGLDCFNKIHNLESLSLTELLKLIDQSLTNNSLAEGKNYKKKLAKIKELLNGCSSSIELLMNQINLIVEQYNNVNSEAKKILNNFSKSFSQDYQNFQFFYKSTKKGKFHVKLLNNYMQLKERSDYLKIFISMSKCDNDDRVVKLPFVLVEAEHYQKACNLLNEKINCSKKIPSKNFNKSKKLVSVKPKNFYEGKKIVISQSAQLSDETKETATVNLSMEKAGTDLIYNEKKQPDHNEEVINSQVPLNLKKELTKENILIEAPLKNLSNNSERVNETLLQDYENWNLEFEKWKNDKYNRLYRLFHIIENAPKEVLINLGNELLKCLSLYENDLLEKNNELKKHQKQTISFLKNPAKNKIFARFSQYLKWFDEVFQRITVCRTLILQNEQNPEVQESLRLPSPWADNRAEFNNLLIFYLKVTLEYNKLRDSLISEESKLNNLHRNFVKQVNQMWFLKSLDGVEEGNILSDFDEQLGRVNQLKLAIEQELETKQKIKEKLSLLANPEIVKFYLSRIDPYDTDTKKHLLPLQSVTVESTAAQLLQECNICTASSPTFYYQPSVAYSASIVQSSNQIFYSM